MISLSNLLIYIKFLDFFISKKIERILRIIEGDKQNNFTQPSTAVFLTYAFESTRADFKGTKIYSTKLDNLFFFLKKKNFFFFSSLLQITSKNLSFSKLIL